MAKTKKEGKKKRNRGNFVKNLKRMTNNIELLKKLSQEI
jgi:hypothetical protein